MDINVTHKRVKKIHKTPILQQTAFWSEVKRRQGIQSTAFTIETDEKELSGGSRKDEVRDDILLLFQGTSAGDTIGYIPYGPKIMPSDENKGVFLEKLSEALRPLIPGDCLLLRYDLAWESPWAKENEFYDENGHWKGPPAKGSQEIRLNVNTRYWNLEKANSNNLPTDTLFINLQKAESLLLQEMKPKTRYNTRLSLRKGVTVRRAGPEDLRIWYALYEETCIRNGMPIHEFDKFESVLRTRVHGAKSEADVELLIAEKDQRPLAAMFLVYSHWQATYLYGASTAADRSLMAPYALQWEAIRRAKRRGCLEYDMFGVSPSPNPAHPMYGLYRFKTGFGGTLFHRMGCWDYWLKG